MVETHWDDLRGRRLQYRDHTWELSGDVDVREEGELLAMDAQRADGNRGEPALLHFRLVDAPDSLNPGNLGTHFDSIVREGSRHDLLIKKEARTYRYRLRRLEYA